jgi:hypothetical protein
VRVYISADYADKSGDREVVDLLNIWGSDNKHKVEFVDTARVNSGSVSKNPDCRSCDLKLEFNRQINASSYVIVIIGDKTAQRTAGSGCERNYKSQYECLCTPYKQNSNGSKFCKVGSTVSAGDDVGSINSYSYIRHEFEQAKKRGKKILVLYNSIYKQPKWLPSYMSDYEDVAFPFWTTNAFGDRVGNYQYIKRALGYE